MPHKENIRVCRESLRNLHDFLKAGDLDAARLEQEFISESNPTSIILFEMQQFIQDAIFWDGHRDDSEWDLLKQNAIASALDMYDQLKKNAIVQH